MATFRIPSRTSAKRMRCWVTRPSYISRMDFNLTAEWFTSQPSTFAAYLRSPRRRMPAVAASGPPPLQEAGPGPVQAVPRSGLAVALHPVGDHAYGNDSERCSRYRRLTAHDGSTSQHYGGNRSEPKYRPASGTAVAPRAVTTMAAGQRAVRR